MVGETFFGMAYVGDGERDARACRDMGIPFIGIGAGARAERLAAAGAVRVFRDLSESDLFLDAIDEVTRTA